MFRSFFWNDLVCRTFKKTWKYSLGSSNSISGILKSVSIKSKKIKDKCYHIFHVDELMLTFLS